MAIEILEMMVLMMAGFHRHKGETVSAAFIWNNDLSYTEFHFIAINDCGMLKSQLFIS